MALRQVRILSSETDNTIKQEQNTNVNIKISKPQHSQSAPLYPEVHPLTASEPSHNQNLNFTGQETSSPYQFQPPTSNLIQDRGIADLGIELDTLETKNKFLEMIVQMYESNPLKVNSYVVCESKLLMDMIKLLTECDKVELVIDDSDVGCGCTARTSSRPKVSAKFIKVAKILITKDGKTEDMKYAYNDIYSQFIKYGLSLKLVI